MPYAALPDHRIPFDNDGTLCYKGTTGTGATTLISGAELLAVQNNVFGDGLNNVDFRNAGGAAVFLFFPESREVTACYIVSKETSGGGANLTGLSGSNDTANGIDGTWETASLPGGGPVYSGVFDQWRNGIKAVSFTGPKKTIRFWNNGASGSGASNWGTIHLYGEAAAGAMAHDLVFLDPDLGAGVAFPAPEDFGDQPLGTTVVRPFRIKNTSASRTATNLNIQCNDADFAIGESASGPWVVTINIASLAAGAETATLYVRCTTPAPGAPLAPRFARIIVTCDSGFFG
jgi:hypothetical protein